MRWNVAAVPAAAFVLAASLTAAPAPAGAASCVSELGPGIPPPAESGSGQPGYHAAWYGQSGYARLCAGEQATFTVAYKNAGSLGWYGGKMGESAYLGTWGPEPGQDKASTLGGNGTFGSPNTGWPRHDRIAVQPGPYVGPGQVAWFTFTLQAPQQAGWYRLYLRPLIEGTSWLEDQGVYWQIVVPNADGTIPPEPVRAEPLAVQTQTSSAITVTASWYGPGFYGNTTACGQTYSSTIMGVAHRSLPCGTPVTLSYAGSTVTVPVIDRGPFVYDREFDLSYATKVALGCPDLCAVAWSR